MGTRLGWPPPARAHIKKTYFFFLQLDLVQFMWWDFGVPGMLEVARQLVDLRVL